MSILHGPEPGCLECLFREFETRRRRDCTSLYFNDTRPYLNTSVRNNKKFSRITRTQCDRRGLNNRTNVSMWVKFHFFDKIRGLWCIYIDLTGLIFLSYRLDYKPFRELRCIEILPKVTANTYMAWLEKGFVIFYIRIT